jgi:hypothetical protein
MARENMLLGPMLSLSSSHWLLSIFFWVFIKGKLVYTHDIVVNRIRMLFARLFGDHANSVLII